MIACSTVSVPLPTATFLELAAFLKQAGSDRDPVAAVAEAVDYWIENASWKTETLLPETVVDDGSRGYTWKSVFLPSGTLVRMKYGSDFHYAKVEGDYLVHEGERVSPNQFALRVAGGARDAWRDLWIKRPGDEDYVPADDLRKKKA
ncbi:MAG: hypothetical protein DI565_12850 [Ancylobacter novellus]|uniref:Uncharacterized protein n=1 Tax=Ancylobacter novellus TaxID=921 RepID=A0A2W5KB88_ANCNO|nr:MAG: hypothetical protein DI565_12850 [Ancylobacter novellus]